MQFSSALNPNTPADPKYPGGTPDSEKGPEYILKHAVTIYKTWQRMPMFGANNTVLTINAAPWWADRNRLYSRGMNDLDGLRKTHQLNDGGPNDVQTAMLIPWDASMFQVKVLNTIRHLLENRDTKLRAYALDPTSVSMRDLERSKRRAKVHMANDQPLKQVDAAMGVNSEIPRDQPQNDRELDLYEQMGPKDQQTATLTNAVALLHNKNNYKGVLRPRMVAELIDTGLVAVAIRPGKDGFPEARSIRCEDAILPTNLDGIFDDMPFGGWLDWLTPEEVVEEMGSEARAGDCEQLKTLAGNSDGRIWTFNGRTYSYSRAGLVPVMRMYYKDLRGLVVSERESRDGGVMYTPGMAPSKKWKPVGKPYQVVCQANWVVGSADPGSTEQAPKARCISWACKVMEHMPRNGVSKDGYTKVSPDGGYYTKIPMVVVGHNMVNMCTQSITELVRSRMNEIELLTIQLRNSIQSIVPPGLGRVATDEILAAMEDLDMDPKEKIAFAMRMFRQTGSYPAKNMAIETPAGMSIGGPTIQPHAGLIPDLQALIGAIESLKAWMHEAVGVNDATLGNTTDTKQLVGSLKIQVQGTQAALGTLFSCFDRLERDVALLEFNTLRCSLLEGKVLEGPMDDLFGQPAGQWMEFTAEDDPGCVGIMVEQLINDEDRIRLHEMCMRALDTGQITVADVLAIERMDNYALATQLLDSRIKMKAEADHARQMEVMNAQSQGVLQSTQAQAQAKSQDVALQVDAEGQIMQMKVAAEAQLMDKKLEHDKLLKALDASTKTIEQSNRQQHEMMMLMAKMSNESSLRNREMDVKKEISAETVESKEEIAEKSNETTLEVAKSRPKPQN